MERSPHSGLGIVSFIASIVTGILMLVVFLVAGLMEVSTPGGIDENSPAAVLVGLFFFALLGAAAIGLALGVAGLLQENRQKVFAVLGTIFSVLILVGSTLVMLLGLVSS